MVDIVLEINRYQSQFLVHSFIYYKLNRNIISDEQYDTICKKLYQLQQEHKDILDQTAYNKLTKQLDESGSGYYINDYPEMIITNALHILHYKSDTNETFPQFISRWGYKIKE